MATRVVIQALKKIKDKEKSMINPQKNSNFFVEIGIAKKI
jgi:hypothetical protein